MKQLCLFLLSILFLAYQSTTHAASIPTPFPVITHSFTLPRPLSLSAAEINALTQVYCNAIGEYFCKSVYLYGQTQVSATPQVISAIQSVIGNEAPDASSSETGLDLKDILSRDIGTYTPFRDNIVDESNPTSFFSSFYVHLTPNEARAHPRPHLFSSLRDEQMMSLEHDQQNQPSIPVPVSSLLTPLQAQRVLVVSGVNVTVQVGIKKADGISVWQLATYIGKVKDQIVRNIQTLLTATDVYGFSVAHIAEYPDHCSNGVEDSTETGVDCGGSNICVRCDGGQPCIEGSDCLSLQCVGGKCEKPRQLRRYVWDE